MCNKNTRGYFEWKCFFYEGSNLHNRNQLPNFRHLFRLGKFSKALTNSEYYNSFGIKQLRSSDNFCHVDFLHQKWVIRKSFGDFVTYIRQE